MKILSIDPGKNGAIVVADYSKGIHEVKLESFKMPVQKNNDFDLKEIEKIFSARGKFNMCVMEDVHSIFGMSAKSNFQFGRIVGILEAHMSATGKPYSLVKPKDWQKISWEGIQKVKDPKKNSLAAAKRLFPGESFLATQRSTVPHDGIIDAVLISYYAFCKWKH